MMTIRTDAINIAAATGISGHQVAVLLHHKIILSKNGIPEVGGGIER